jgi:hypothetical protein
MKLSEIKGERVFDVIADVIDPIVSIAQDEDAAALFRPQPLPEGMEPWDFFLSRVKRSLPPLMRTHKEDFITIMASLHGVSRDEYAEGVTMASLFSDLIELVTDTEFASFFG